MRSREMQLRNFFANVDVHVRRAKPGAPHARWDVSAGKVPSNARQCCGAYQGC